MSESLATQATRRELTARQAETVRKLTEAGVDEVRRVGYEHLSIRDVARRAGVAAATAYTYFASRDHLLTEIFWRRLKALPPVITSPPAVKERAAAVLRELALIVSAEPELAAGCAAAMFGSDPNLGGSGWRSASRSGGALRLSPGLAAPPPGFSSLLTSVPWLRLASVTQHTDTWPTGSPRRRT